MLVNPDLTLARPCGLTQSSSAARGSTRAAEAAGIRLAAIVAVAITTMDPISGDGIKRRHVKQQRSHSKPRDRGQRETKRDANAGQAQALTQDQLKYFARSRAECAAHAKLLPALLRAVADDTVDANDRQHERDDAEGGHEARGESRVRCARRHEVFDRSDMRKGDRRIGGGDRALDLV